MNAGLWERIYPSGAWRVTDARMYELGEFRERSYWGYSKREAMREHAAYIRDLKARSK